MSLGAWHAEPVPQQSSVTSFDLSVEQPMKAPLPENETERLAALRGLGILDTSPELAYDELCSLAAFVCQSPVALISLVDEDRQWFKSRVGWTTPRRR
jgi:hypothetical protein